MKTWLLAAIFCLISSAPLLAQQIHPLKGRVIENDAYRTPLYGATVWFPDLERGATTNLSGYFSFDALPEGEHRLRVSFVGYEAIETTVEIPAGEEPVFALDRDPMQLDELEVLAEAEASMQAQQTRLSTIKVTALPFTNIPRLMGEPDLIRIIQTLPGVKTESDFTGGFHVRGGRNDQNLILLDGVPVYNPWHLFGLFSAFNTEAIESVELTKGVFPAKFGSRVSSVLDIGLQQGSERLGAGYLTVSPLSASFSYGRPLNQNTSYLFSLRRTYMDPVFWVLNKALREDNEFAKVTYSNGYHFYDLNLKLVHRFSPGLSLEAAYYRSSDQLNISEKQTGKREPNISYLDHDQLGWRNNTGSLKLRYRTPRLVSETQAFLTFYNADNIEQGVTENDRVLREDKHPPYVLTAERDERRFDQRFQDMGVQQDWTFFAGDGHTLYLGGQWLLHNFRDISTFRHTEEGYFIDPADARDFWRNPPPSPSQQILNRFSGDSLSAHAHEFGIYLSAGLHVGSVSFYPGIRYQGYTAGGTHVLLPRLNASWKISPAVVVAAGYGHFAQYIHIAGIDLVRVPTERWFWSNEQRRPIDSRMATLGFGYDFGENGFLSVEGYYKTLNNLLSFDPQAQAEAIDGTDILPRFGSDTIEGSGEAFGVEFFWEKSEGNLTGWLGYTLSWVWNRFEELNNGERFPARTDKRHDVQLFLNWGFAENWSLGSLFNFKTGQPVPFSTGHYQVERDPLGIGDRAGSRQRDGWVVKKVNDFRLPAYHRLDINVTWKNRRIFKRPAEVSLNVINVYNNLNPLTLLTSTSTEKLPNDNIRVFPDNRYVSQLPVLPVLSMRIALAGDAK